MFLAPVGEKKAETELPMAKPRKLLAPCAKPVAKLRSSGSSTSSRIGHSPQELWKNIAIPIVMTTNNCWDHMNNKYWDKNNNQCYPNSYWWLYIHPEILHVWYIYLHVGDFFGANVDTWSIHGAYGLPKSYYRTMLLGQFNIKSIVIEYISSNSDDDRHYYHQNW